MDDLRAILDKLEDRELDYVVERSKVTTDAEALKSSGLPRSTFYQWPEEKRDMLNGYAQQMKRRARYRAQLKLEEAAEEAAERIVTLMKNRNANVALRAAQDVLDRTAGKATQRAEVSGPDGGALVITVRGVTDDDGDH